ncbi:MAG: choice-of-anchor D domain-containing protein [Candidatus Kapabacteria bacterium]|nr:choice-of-anchor D domain-containing protein [Candidatus Kapabacteria bacterium]
MKFKLLLVMLSIAAFNMFVPQDAFSVKKYYIFFDNFEDQKDGNGVEITNLIDLCYWDHLRTDLNLGAYAERKPFNALTLSQRDITEYDVAIFVMGTTNTLSSSVDGIKVFDQIQKMLNANKSVIIIGSNILLGAFGQGGDAQVKNWMQNFLGVTDPKIFSHMSGNTINGMRVDGVEGDPVSRGYKKQCNRIYEENNSGPQGPIRWYAATSFFTVNGGKNAVAFDYIKEIDSVDVTDTRVTGVRAEDNKARVVFYSINFDISSGTHLIHFENALTNAVKWEIRDVPHPEGFLSVENESVDFDKIEMNQSGFQTAVFRNSGREPFTISKIEIAGDEPAGTFEIVEGGTGLLMNPGDVHFVNLKFSPKEERNFEDYLTVTSDAYNKSIEVKLIGIGGENVFNGPKLSLSTYPVDFGTVPFGLYSESNIKISNIGNVAMVVETVLITNDADKRFTFGEVVKVPITIPPGITHNIKVRFTSADEVAGDYTGRIDITSNAFNNEGKGFIDLKARSAGQVTNSGITLSSTNIDFGEVDILKPDLKTLKISNTGFNNLRIFDARFDIKSGGENNAQFTFFEDSNKNIPELKPGESHDLKIQFHPEKVKEYATRIQLTTNDPINEGIVEVPIVGVGIDPSTVNDNIASVTGLKVSVNPSPVTDLSKVEFTVEVPGNIVMDIVDQTGRKLDNLFNGYANQGIHTQDLNARNYVSGVYFISISYNGQKLQLPFLVTK